VTCLAEAERRADRGRALGGGSVAPSRRVVGAAGVVPTLAGCLRHSLAGWGFVPHPCRRRCGPVRPARRCAHEPFGHAHGDCVHAGYRVSQVPAQGFLAGDDITGLRLRAPYVLGAQLFDRGCAGVSRDRPVHRGVVRPPCTVRQSLGLWPAVNPNSASVALMWLSCSPAAALNAGLVRQRKHVAQRSTSAPRRHLLLDDPSQVVEPIPGDPVKQHLVVVAARIVVFIAHVSWTRERSARFNHRRRKPASKHFPHTSLRLDEPETICWVAWSQPAKQHRDCVWWQHVAKPISHLSARQSVLQPVRPIVVVTNVTATAAQACSSP
jgi:hypothetical protein